MFDEVEPKCSVKFSLAIATSTWEISVIIIYQQLSVSDMFSSVSISEKYTFHQSENQFKLKYKTQFLDLDVSFGYMCCEL